MTSAHRTQEKMKYAVLIGDGMADRPLEELGGRTPLEAADIPNMREIARQGQIGLVRTIPAGMPPGSDVAALSILGYDPKKYYSGRAPLEAARLGIQLSPEEVAFRCNLITVDDGRIVDYAAGHISSEEAKALVELLGRKLGGSSVKFNPGISYRHICVVKDIDLVKVDCTPPHDVMGQSVKENLPRGKGAEMLIGLMERSCDLLRDHEVNKARISRGQRPANMIWLWGQGITPKMPGFADLYGIRGSAISAVDLVNGIARLIGLELIEVPGATGYYDTNYEGKGAYALKSLEEKDFVLVHVEAPDEASHNGDLDQKIRAIENFDRHVVGPFVRKLAERSNLRLMILPDHHTPIQVRTHVGQPVPFACCGQGIAGSGAKAYSEREAAKSGLMLDAGHTLMRRFIRGEKLVE